MSTGASVSAFALCPVSPDPDCIHAGDFVCGRCTRARASQQVVADCGATLIVCPASILQQWQSEIAKHTQPGALKVITYLGQHKTSLDFPSKQTSIEQASAPLTPSAMGSENDAKGRMGRTGKHSGQGVVSAEDLAAADVVLTTYDVLKRDLHHQADPDQQGKTFRTRKRYEVGPLVFQCGCTTSNCSKQ